MANNIGPGSLTAAFWYALATIYEEVDMKDSLTQPTEKDLEAIKNNRRAWNGFVCKILPQEERERLAKQLGEDLSEWKEHERNYIKAKLPEHLRSVVSRNTYDKFTKKRIEELINTCYETKLIIIDEKFCPNPLHMEKFVFVNTQLFGKHIPGTHLEREFSKGISFEGSVFRGFVSVEGVEMRSDLNFKGATFNSSAKFEGTTFHHSANFEGAKFNGFANFKGTNFKRFAEFKNAIFDGEVSFSGSAFEGPTSFEDAEFKEFVPQFFSSELGEDAIFTTDEKKWPNPETSKDERMKDAFSCLRLKMVNQHRPDEEQFFYRQEMAWKAQHEKSHWINWAAINLYGRFSDYGYSLWKPLRYFLIVLGLPLPLVVFGLWQYDTMQDSLVAHLKEGIGCVLRLSIENMLPLFEFNKNRCKEELPFGEATWLWFIISLIQYLASVVFLFLFALALRNRFRLR